MQKTGSKHTIASAGFFYDGIAFFIFSLSNCVIAAYVACKIIQPKWVAGGWPSYNHYPKNVEFGAIVFALLAAALSGVGFSHLRTNRGKLIAASGTAFAASLAAYPYLVYRHPLEWLAILAGIFFILYTLSHFTKNYSEPSSTGIHPFLFFFAGTLGTMLIFLLALGHLFDLTLDAHHFGEQFTSAVDYLNGGRPFETYFWPHGFHDTGLIALGFLVAQKSDIPTMFLCLAAFASMGVGVLFFICHGMGARYVALIILPCLFLLNKSALVLACATIAVSGPAFLSFYIFSRANVWHRFLLSGSISFLAHAYRIEIGIYGVMAVLAFGGYKIISAILIRDYKLVSSKAKGLALYVIGILGTAIIMYVFFGWPGGEWYRIVFTVLPKYLADSAGFPYPLPINQFTGREDFEVVKRATSYLISLMVSTAVISRYLYTNLKMPESGDAFFTISMIFAIVMSRNAFGRSDSTHIDFSATVLYLMLLIILFRVVVRSGFAKRAVMAAGISCIVMVGAKFGPVVRGMQSLASYREIMPDQCTNGLFSAHNMLNPTYTDFEARVCETKKILNRYNLGKKQLLISHSAAIQYAALGYSLPTKYYCLGWAITNSMQRDLIGELEKSNVSAILLTNNFGGGLPEYDVPNSVRMPLYSEWVERRFDFSNIISTPLGQLVLKKSDSLKAHGI